MNFKKRVNGSWTDTPHYIHNTSTDTLTTLPAVLYPNDTTATVGLKGNTTQSGTPTPTAPIYPTKCGDKTANLCEVSNSNCIIYSTYNQFTITNDIININGNALFGFMVKCSPNTQYTVSSTRTGYNCDMRIREYSEKPSDWTSDFITQSVNVGSATQSVSFTTNSATKYILVCFYGSNTSEISDIMLNSGSTALPYEPFGIKIPISSASTTTPVYLGEVETTRKIKKLVLTGKEIGINNRTSPENSYSISIDRNGWSASTTGYGISSHFLRNGNVATLIDGEFYVGSTAFSFRLDDCADTTAFRQYLAAQYAAGTPVTVWYVLATEETGIVNEPLRKIGNYADTVSGITIPTTAGTNIIDVDTTLKPSEVSVNYHGWHPVQSVHERENGAWD